MKLLKFLVFFLFALNLNHSIFANQSECSFVTCIDCNNNCDTTELNKCCDDGTIFAKTFFSFRPQDSDTSRRILGYFNGNPAPCNYFKFAVQYYHSFDAEKLAKWFFFNCKDCMSVGIPSEDRVFDIDGSQIGLSLGNSSPTTLNTGLIGTVCAKPVVQNVIFDFDFQFSLDDVLCGLWTKINFDVVTMKTDLNLCQSGHGEIIDDFPAGLFTTDGVGTETCQTTPVPYACILDALQGDNGWGDVSPLFCSKFSISGLRKTGLAGFHVELGYDFCNNDPFYLSASLYTVFPTGSRPQGKYLFEPVIGANKSWQFGATMLTNYVLDFCDDNQLGFYLYIVGTHLFKSKQTRTFALKNNGPGSQLLLLKKFNPAVTEIKEVQRVANILCGETRIGASFMFDGSFMTQLSCCDFFIDLGYNFWIRTKEKRDNVVCFKGFYEDQLGIKGHEFLTEEIDIGCPGSPPICAYDLNTASQSTISQPGPTDNVTTFITPADIDFGAPLHPTAWSNKLFAGIGYNGCVFFLVSGEVEFGRKNMAVNQWGVMIKVGKDF